MTAFERVPAELASALAAAEPALGPFAALRYVSAIDSTNDAALALAAAGAPEGASVLADSQRSGRGRRGREWFSPPGAGIYLSVVVRPPDAASAVSLVTLGAGVAAASAIRRMTGLHAELKWPNDIVIGRPWRKLGGVLCEAASMGGRIEALVIGMGLNVRLVTYPHHLGGLPASLEGELGRAVDSAPLVVALLREIQSMMARLHGGDAAGIREAWRTLARPGLSGAHVRWHEAGRDRRGRVRDIDADGALLVDADGREERLVAGEVLWESWSRE
jgi:BirA family biotin operon repressor/biotin-[acetyl-CoA-carboxylase] ligase